MVIVQVEYVSHCQPIKPNQFKCTGFIIETVKICQGEQIKKNYENASSMLYKNKINTETEF